MQGGWQGAAWRKAGTRGFGGPTGETAELNGVTLGLSDQITGVGRGRASFHDTFPPSTRSQGAAASQHPRLPKSRPDSQVCL